MEFVKKYKKILIAVAVLAAVFGGYYYWSSSHSADSGPTLTYDAGLPGNPFIGQEILGILEQLRHLQIDGSVFDSPAFKSLVDYSIATTSEPKGRSDPFAPLPSLPPTKIK